MKSLNLSEVEYLAYHLSVFTEENKEFKEPIPAFQTRFPKALESCLAVPFQRFQGKDLYKGLLPKASMLFYLMIKNHPFQNGNKRIAMAVLLIFLYKNRKWLKADNQELYNFVIWVTTSPGELKNEVTKGITKFLKSHLIDIKY